MSRRRLIPLRLFVVGVIFAAMSWRPGFGFLIPWTGAYLVVQLFEHLALAQFLRPGRPSWIVGLNLAADFSMSMVFGWIALPMWAMNGPTSAAAATLLLTGSVLTSLMAAEGCRFAFTASVTPHVGYLFLAPLTLATRGDAGTYYYLLGAALFSLVLALVFAWTRRTLRAERAARRTAEAQTAAKSAFIAMVSHELRTPMSAILTGAANLSRDARNARSRDGAALIVDAGAMMRSLLNDLLDFSKIEAGRMSVERLDFDPRALVDDTARFWRGEALAKGLALALDTGPLPDWVQGDPVRLRQILNNLLSNAIKFTPKGHVALTIEAERAGEGWLLRLVVADTGPGLSADQLPRLFTAYDQLGVDTARTFGGTGLGLSISRDLARLMGGDLVAEARPEGGARFILTLPAPPGAAPADPDTAAPDLAAFTDAPLALVVDDHEVNRRLLGQILDALGLRVELAVDGEAALAVADGRRFDVILMDVNMPGLDGLDATRRLRADGPNRVTPVIAVTAGSSDAEREACRAAGMSDWVEKPFDTASLHRALSQALAVRA
jgi:signal transduction histidine kinase/ActR/RegA family two-component response regulator